MPNPASPSSPTTEYAPVPPSPPTNKPRDDNDTARTPSAIAVAILSRRIPVSRQMMFGAIGTLVIVVLVRTYLYVCETPDLRFHAGNPSASEVMMMHAQSIPKIPQPIQRSWMDKIVFHRSSLADVSHELKRRKQNRGKEKHRTASKEDDRRLKNEEGDDHFQKIDEYDDMIEDLSIMHQAVVDSVRDVGVRGLLFEVLSDDFEYYVYGSADELDHYWRKCSSKHGVGENCNEWDVWWTYHYVGAIITDMLLQDEELLWDGSSGERIVKAGASMEDQDASMATLLDKIHDLQATLPYLTQSSFHAQHALIWRYVVKSSGRLSSSYPWDLAIQFCRGDGSRRKGILGRPVNKAIDHECFHGFGHAMFYAVATRQLAQDRGTTSSEDKDEKEPFMVIAPHSGFTLSQKSYCDVYDLCQGASPENREILDPNDEAKSNSYRICFEGVVHSVRLLSNDYSHVTHKQDAKDLVDKQMKRCASAKKKTTKKTKSKA
eukprot:jgi/Psemu1/11286/gm1.11286_g